jgi:hypothetical protein
MSKDVPTPDDITAAHYYAVSLLCTEIPTKYGGPGLTTWDTNNKTCRVTKKGCQPDVRNPITQPLFDADGRVIEYDESDMMFGEFWKKNPPGYYVWRTTKNSPRTEVCARGNYLMQQWCESPKMRSDKNIPGVTDVIPFKYVVKNGKEVCEIPEAYCKAKGVSYKNGDCYVSPAQKVAEFFTSSVVVRSDRASDKRLKKNITLLRKDFIDKGIHVYMYEWNDVAQTVYGFVGFDIGFIADELDPKYVTHDSLGYKTINTSIQDDTMKKIYAFLKIKDTIKNVYIQ